MKRCIDISLNQILLVAGVVLLWVFVQVFLLASFRIPSDSIEPELTEGNFVAVWKPMLGAQPFDLYTTLRLEQTEIHRTPEFWKAMAEICFFYKANSQLVIRGLSPLIKATFKNIFNTSEFVANCFQLLPNLLSQLIVWFNTKDDFCNKAKSIIATCEKVMNWSWNSVCINRDSRLDKLNQFSGKRKESLLIASQA